jgi:TRAP-type C4-dicarboxylate transport system permease small subunit
MDALYAFCAGIAGLAMLVISLIIPWGVFTRYVLNQASSWPEPMATLLSIVLTFFGAAACYRLGVHMRVAVLPNMLPPAARRLCDALAQALVAVVNLYMVVWGWDLVQTTWNQGIPDFPGLSVGVTYLPIPLGGACTLLFVLERLLIGPKQAEQHVPTDTMTAETVAFE